MILIYFLILQTSQSPIYSPAAKYYIYMGESGELQLKVSIWGEIASPGLYSISEDVDLATLISLAGGPTENADLSRIKIVCLFPVPQVINVNLSRFFKTGDRSKVPFLKPGDMVRVNGTGWNRIYKFTRWVTETTLIIGVYFQLYNLFTQAAK